MARVSFQRCWLQVADLRGARLQLLDLSKNRLQQVSMEEAQVVDLRLQEPILRPRAVPCQENLLTTLDGRVLGPALRSLQLAARAERPREPREAGNRIELVHLEGLDTALQRLDVSENRLNWLKACEKALSHLAKEAGTFQSLKHLKVLVLSSNQPPDLLFGPDVNRNRLSRGCESSTSSRMSCPGCLWALNRCEEGLKTS